MYTKIVHIIIVLLFTVVAAKSQGFIISPLSGSHNSYTITSTPIILDGSNKCLISVSGLSVLRIAINKTGSFEEACVETPPIDTISGFSISLNLFPNPTKALTTIKAVAVSGIDTDLACQISILNMEGKIVMNKIVPVQVLRSGFVFDVSGYSAGVYTAVVGVINHQYSVRFIKK